MTLFHDDTITKRSENARLFLQLEKILQLVEARPLLPKNRKDPAKSRGSCETGMADSMRPVLKPLLYPELSDQLLIYKRNRDRKS